MSRLDVIQTTAWYPPFGVGGTEVYLEGLVEELIRQGIATTVLVPRQANASEAYAHRACRVETYPVNEVPSSSELKNQAPHTGFDDFRRLLVERRSAIYHQHSWTRGCGLTHLKEARDLGMRTVLTVHVPGNFCLRGTMLRFGEEPCDGLVEPQRCGACWAQARGLPMAAAKAVGHLPRTFARVAHVSPGRMATALSARYIGECMVQQVASMITYADRIVAVCQWLYDALVINGVPREKLVLSRQGVASEVLSTLTAVRAAERRVGGPLRLLALGRWDPVKGLDLAVRAILALPREAPVVLKIHGIPVVGAGEYEMRTRHLAEGDTRICIEGPLPHERIAEAFADSDVLLAPSNWLETGPLTVLEAQAAGLFVLGSRRGGIAELVDEPNGGWLLEPDDVGIWSDALAKLVEIHSHSKLSVSSGSLRTMTAAAADMIELYRSL